MAKVMNPTLNLSVCDIISWKPVIFFHCAILIEVLKHTPLNKADCFVKGVANIMKPGWALFFKVPHLNEPIHLHHYHHFIITKLRMKWESDFQIEQVFGFEKRGLLRGIISYCLCNSFFLLKNHHMFDLLHNFYMKCLFYVKHEQ